MFPGDFFRIRFFCMRFCSLRRVGPNLFKIGARFFNISFDLLKPGQIFVDHAKECLSPAWRTLWQSFLSSLEFSESVLIFRELPSICLSLVKFFPPFFSRCPAKFVGVRKKISRTARYFKACGQLFWFNKLFTNQIFKTSKRLKNLKLGKK